MELRILTEEQGKTVWETDLHRDFPESELKSWDLTCGLIRSGVYEMLDFWENGVRVGYAWMLVPEGDAVLLESSGNCGHVTAAAGSDCCWKANTRRKRRIPPWPGGGWASTPAAAW